jgi:2-haloacid dehalogenase
MSRIVDTVIFDIGNVLIEWDPENLYRKLIPDDAERHRFLGEVCTMDWNLQQDLGRTWDVAIQELTAQFPDEAELIAAYSERWQEMVPGEITGSVAILDALKDAGVPLYAITNFSSEKFEETKLRFPFLASSFKDIVVSAEERLLKPDRRIFEILVERNNLIPSGCVFIDDSLKNVEGARNAGLEAIHFTGSDKLRQELSAYGLPV